MISRAKAPVGIAGHDPRGIGFFRLFFEECIFHVWKYTFRGIRQFLLQNRLRELHEIPDRLSAISRAPQIAMQSVRKDPRLLRRECLLLRPRAEHRLVICRHSTAKHHKHPAQHCC